MASYSATCVNNRLQAVVTTIGNAGFMVLRSGASVIVSITLASPCGTVSGGVLTFSGTLQDTATGTGSVDNAIITDSLGAEVVSDLTVGIPFSGSQIIVTNGLNSTLVNSGQVVQVLSATITGTGELAA